ncbi:hypothetical protein Thi970DRAFT_00205 [Thiorhodovibrio frisius]|uniref:Uncharacterized protein n=1 Tax=Thiorhodovibrio frisius TaxID=631362 RepID=H8YWA3_9GAMM|nr:hypothetical protein Thi970DRAFT_00205 [Thiorhodovibrio frisius]WPL20095.1 hypothetical protein Thiofri_00151 [Thiorhodovibrio frisius]
MMHNTLLDPNIEPSELSGRMCNFDRTLCEEMTFLFMDAV